MVTVVYFPRITESRQFKSESRYPSQRSADPWYSPVFQCLMCGGDITGVLSNGAVACCCVLMQVNRCIPTKCKIFWILHWNRSQNIIECHDKNIWKYMCIKNLSYSTDTYLRYNYQREKTGRNIHLRYILRIGPIPTK